MSVSTKVTVGNSIPTIKKHFACFSIRTGDTTLRIMCNIKIKIECRNCLTCKISVLFNIN